MVLFNFRFYLYILWRWLLEYVTEILEYIFIIYRVELWIPPSNTMLKLLVILFGIKLYARINIFMLRFIL